MEKIIPISANGAGGVGLEICGKGEELRAYRISSSALRPSGRIDIPRDEAVLSNLITHLNNELRDLQQENRL